MKLGYQIKHHLPSLPSSFLPHACSHCNPPIHSSIPSVATFQIHTTTQISQPYIVGESPMLPFSSPQYTSNNWRITRVFIKLCFSDAISLFSLQIRRLLSQIWRSPWLRATAAATRRLPDLLVYLTWITNRAFVYTIRVFMKLMQSVRQWFLVFAGESMVEWHWASSCFLCSSIFPQIIIFNFRQLLFYNTRLQLIHESLFKLVN